MSDQGDFIRDKEEAKKVCVKQRCCDSLEICLAIRDKLDNKNLTGAYELLDVLYNNQYIDAKQATTNQIS